MTMSPYPLNTAPAATPAEAHHPLVLENTTLRMRVAVLSEALRAAEEELNTYRFGERTAPASTPGKHVRA